MTDISDQRLEARDRDAVEDLLGTASAERERGDLEAASGSYRKALTYYEDADDQPGIARVRYELGRIAQDQADFETARQYFDVSLDLYRQVGDQAGEARCLYQLGRIARDQGDRAAARERYEKSLSLLQDLNDQAGIAAAQRELGWLALNDRDYEAARRLFEESSSQFEAAGDAVGAAYAVGGLGWVAHDQRDYAAAQQLFEDSLSALQSEGHDLGIGHAHRDLAWNALDREGDYDAARVHAEESLRILESTGHQIEIAHSAYVLGRVLAEQDNAGGARRLFERSLDIYQKAGALEGIARNLYRLGRLTEDEGKVYEAERQYDQSLQISQRLDNQRGMANNMYRLGLIAQTRGDLAEAVRLFRRTRDAFRAVDEEEAAAEAERALAALGEPTADAGEAPVVPTGFTPEVAAAVEQALRAAQGLTDPVARAEALCGVARTLAEVGETRQALALAEQAREAASMIEDDQPRADALREIAHTLAEAGDSAQSVMVAEQALEAAEAIRDERSRLADRRELAPVLALGGATERALAVADSISDEHWRAMAQRGVAQALAQTGDSQRAVSVAEAIPDARYRTEALNSIAQMLAESGDRQSAQEVAKQALTAMDTIRDAFSTADLRRDVAVTLAQAGATEQASAVADDIEAAERRADALTGVAYTLAQAGDTDAVLVAERALEAAGALGNVQWRAEALVRVAAVLAQIGDTGRAAEVVDGAVTAAESVDDTIARADALTAVALGLVQMGDVGRANYVADQILKTADALEGEPARADALRGATVALAAAGDTERALSVAESIGVEGVQASALREIALALTQQGDIERALSVAGNIKNEQARAKALSGVAAVAAQPARVQGWLGLASEDWLASPSAEEPAVGIGTVDDAAQAQVEPIRRYRAKVELLETPPSLLLPDEEIAVRVAVTNLGDEPWPADGPDSVSVGYRIEPEDPASETPEPMRRPLDAAVEPGESAEVVLPLTAPHQAGQYLVQWDTRYADDDKWFSDHSNAWLYTTSLEVVPPDALLSRLDNLSSLDGDERIRLIETATRALLQERDPTRREQLQDRIGGVLFDVEATTGRAAGQALHDLRTRDPAVDDWLRALFADRQPELEPIVDLTTDTALADDVRDWLSALLPTDAAATEPQPETMQSDEEPEDFNAQQPRRTYQAKVSLDGDPPALMLPGEKATVRLIIYNTGNTPWDASGPDAVTAGYQILPEDPSGESTPPSRRTLEAEVHPDEGVGLPLAFSAPQAPGTYRVVWDLAYQDDERWFSAHEDREPLTTELEVVPLAALRSNLADLPSQDRDQRIKLIQAAARVARDEGDPAMREELRDLIGQGLFDDMATVGRAAAYALHDIRDQDPAVDYWLADLLADRQADLEPVVRLTKWRSVSADAREWLSELLPADLAEAEPEPRSDVEAADAPEVAKADDREAAPTGDGRAREPDTVARGPRDEAAPEVAAPDGAGAAPQEPAGPPPQTEAEAELADVGASELAPDPYIEPEVRGDATTVTIRQLVYQNIIQDIGRPEAPPSTHTLDIHLTPRVSDRAAEKLDEKAADEGRRYEVVLKLLEPEHGQVQESLFEGPLKLDVGNRPLGRVYGDALHRALFHDDEPENHDRVLRGQPGRQTLGTGYRAALARRRNGILRLRLRINNQLPELHDYKWEYLWDAQGAGGGPLACWDRTPFSRTLHVGADAPVMRPRISEANPLRLLAAMANPAELATGDAGQRNPDLAGLAPIETTELQVAVDRIARIGDLIAPLDGDNTLYSTTAESLRNRLAGARRDGEPYQALHLLCHGLVSRADGQPYLVLEREGSGHAELISDVAFAELIEEFVPGLQLVVLASCLTAPPAHEHALKGVARRLVADAEVPAVVAMQDNLEFEAAQYFAQRLYDDLVRHGEVDRAVNAARNELYRHRRTAPGGDRSGSVGPKQWGVPVVFMRVPDGRLFDLEDGDRAADRPPIQAEAVPYADVPGTEPRGLMENILRSTAAQMGLPLPVSPQAVELLQQAWQATQGAPQMRAPEEPPVLFGQPGQRRQRQALIEAARRHRHHPARRTILFLRHLARRRVGRRIAQHALRNLTADQFRGEIWAGGSVTWPDPEAVVDQLLDGGPAAGLDGGHPLLQFSGRDWRRHHRGFDGDTGDAVAQFEFTGNLTFAAQGRNLEEGQLPAAADLEDLLYGNDPVAAFAALTADAARADRGLDERTASLMLHAIAPDEYVPYHRDLAGEVLTRLRLRGDERYDDGFRGYCALARDMLADDDLGLEDLADVGYFLQRLADDRIRLPEIESARPVPRSVVRPVNLDPDAIHTGLVLRQGVLQQATAALNAGKHLILIGPPGTGKTTLAEDLCRSARDRDCNRGHILVTATADWTTFDTIGGYMPMPEAGNRLVFRPGIFLDAIDAGKWLVIDEINRADIDKAFGELFTLLSGQAVTLPYQAGGRGVSIVPPGQAPPTGTRSYTIPESWRIVATMNVYDKASLFEMSYAFMRRFAFVDVAIPQPAAYQQLIDLFAAAADLPTDDDVHRQLCNLFDTASAAGDERNPLMLWRALGPAIAQDVVRYLAQRKLSAGALTPGHLTEALLLYVVPQFDGLEQRQILAIHRHLADVFAGVAGQRALLERIEELFPFIPDDRWEHNQETG